MRKKKDMFQSNALRNRKHFPYGGKYNTNWGSFVEVKIAGRYYGEETVCINKKRERQKAKEEIKEELCMK